MIKNLTWMLAALLFGFTLFHSTKDEVVPVCNLNAVDAAWSQSGDASALPFCGYWYSNSSSYLHLATGMDFYLKYSGGMVKDIINGKWKSGRFER